MVHVHLQEEVLMTYLTLGFSKDYLSIISFTFSYFDFRYHPRTPSKSGTAILFHLSKLGEAALSSAGLLSLLYSLPVRTWNIELGQNFKIVLVEDSKKQIYWIIALIHLASWCECRLLWHLISFETGLLWGIVMKPNAFSKVIGMHHWHASSQ